MLSARTWSAHSRLRTWYGAAPSSDAPQPSAWHATALLPAPPAFRPGLGAGAPSMGDSSSAGRSAPAAVPGGAATAATASGLHRMSSKLQCAGGESGVAEPACSSPAADDVSIASSSAALPNGAKPNSISSAGSAERLTFRRDTPTPACLLSHAVGHARPQRAQSGRHDPVEQRHAMQRLKMHSREQVEAVSVIEASSLRV